MRKEKKRYRVFSLEKHPWWEKDLFFANLAVAVNVARDFCNLKDLVIVNMESGEVVWEFSQESELNLKREV